ncbi:MAG: diphosphomevalonate/mevalonate 3,5-bisphosphate decarboxylase family protein [Candidatus Zhuqueibacterota bacterium]
MTTHIPENFYDTVSTMRAAQQEILVNLREIGIEIPDYPDLKNKGREEGAAVAKAYPMQGILKYHGMTDWDWRISYLPSISVNNDAAYSLTLVSFEKQLPQDDVTIQGVKSSGRELDRVTRVLDVVREIAGISTYARVISKNVVRASITGKGLGTSASGSAALATAAIAAVFGTEAVENTRFLTTLSRLLAGSGSRSAAGGVSLWLSHPGIAHEDSFAVRLDSQNQLDNLCLITIPIASKTGLHTETAHGDAPNSQFFRCWMYNRKREIMECISAIQAGDWKTVGQLAELDSIQLHGITMSGSRENKIFAWEPENIILFRMCNDLRSKGIPVYFSTDTGPTMVLLTDKVYENQVVEAIQSLNLNLEIIRGKIAGPSQLVDLADAVSLDPTFSLR